MISILYVDDDPDIREIATMALALDPELEVQAVSSGKEALALLERGWTPDLLLLDMMMPEMDGPATLAAIRARPHLRAVPAVFITARSRARERIEMEELDVAGVIAKPFDPLSLAASLRHFLSRGAGQSASEP
jgi:CheY-like chemotaxis protein